MTYDQPYYGDVVHSVTTTDTTTVPEDYWDQAMVTYHKAERLADDSDIPDVEPIF